MRRSFTNYIAFRESKDNMADALKHIGQMQEYINSKGRAEYIRDSRLRAWMGRVLGRISSFANGLGEEQDPDEKLVKLKKFRTELERAWMDFEEDQISGRDPGERWSTSKKEDKVEELLDSILDKVAQSI